ncbi:putative oxidoreductase [Rosa chinensis]|uniref:Putative oxidoreductase n=1 Tax=Rosa chinensis TaxID=74649 RepID=A0A2P6Q4E5_ROSCH|nr:uncharacterized protein LOC112165525 [Rosa chinensis]XP_024157840.1 uncharacterized protein LOC112165525 [Rosa chinensis]XP_040362678.1 uncharacterized protein LOC112165525 [Rosa chinensis]XP_040362679.1 uncharacterized protein LOC112165525 [Rosa chinensis]PRQ29053.1 putative oxidoreductase [Rosa chinensis]
MADPNPPPENVPPPSSAKAATETKKFFSGEKVHFPNPPDPTNPDPATLREQWKYAIRQYSRMYSHAWGTAILAGASFFALGWFIKGGNPLPSFGTHHDPPPPPPPPPADNTDEPRRA